MVKNLFAVLETQVWSLGWDDPLEKEMASHFGFLPGESHGQRSLAGYSPWGHKEQTWLSDQHFHFFIFYYTEIMNDILLFLLKYSLYIYNYSCILHL